MLIQIIQDLGLLYKLYSITRPHIIYIQFCQENTRPIDQLPVDQWLDCGTGRVWVESPRWNNYAQGDFHTLLTQGKYLQAQMGRPNATYSSLIHVIKGLLGAMILIRYG